mmetsp:Transcript_77178/g.218285  ORF Transcript_77178/g.218285 Transcript_77178/m.218285 type:complete len:86 (+) Transcript_77178:1-258(+)
MWYRSIRANGGDSWCVTLWSTARLIQKAGCESVRIRCGATSVDLLRRGDYWEAHYDARTHPPGAVDLPQARECLRRKCYPDAVLV